MNFGIITTWFERRSRDHARFSDIRLGGKRRGTNGTLLISV